MSHLIYFLSYFSFISKNSLPIVKNMFSASNVKCYNISMNIYCRKMKIKYELLNSKRHLEVKCYLSEPKN